MSRASKIDQYYDITAFINRRRKRIETREDVSALTTAQAVALYILQLERRIDKYESEPKNKAEGEKDMEIDDIPLEMLELLGGDEI